jgi:hypothetical protein
MTNTLPQDPTPAQDGLSPFARVCIDADRSQGKTPRYHEGMTVKDAEIITGLPRAEVLARMKKLENHETGYPNETLYIAVNLSEGAGEKYAEQMKQQAPKTAEVIQLKLGVFAQTHESDYFNGSLLDSGWR